MQKTWNGEKGRPLGLHRPCECGCDARGGLKGVGYLTGSDANGDGFTLWIEDEDVFAAIERVMSNVEFSGGAPLHGAASAGTQGSASPPTRREN